MEKQKIETDISNAIPKEYKVAFGIEATTGAMVESLYYLDGSKEINLPNLTNSGSKVITDSTYGTITHKLNPVYGVGADTVKGVVGGKDIGSSVNDAIRSNIISVTGGYLGHNGGFSENTIRVISSGTDKYIDYQIESNNHRGNKND